MFKEFRDDLKRHYLLWTVIALITIWGVLGELGHERLGETWMWLLLLPGGLRIGLDRYADKD